MLEPFGPHAPRIDPSAFVHTAAVVIGQVVVGAESSIWPCATLRADDGPIVIGRQTSIQDGTVVHMTEGLSTTTVGDRVIVGHNAILHGCTIGDECLIGMGAIVLDNAVVEPGAIVGAGALVPVGRTVKAGTLVVGSPCKVLRETTVEDAEQIAFGWKIYVERARQFRKQAAT